MGISIEMFKFYEVGGKIRDELLGLTNKDVDYVAVPNTDDTMLLECYTANEMFAKLEHHLREEGFEIFLVTPDCYTIRARFPNWYKYQGVADFVMARKEVGYIPGTRTPIVVPGNLYDDPLRILRAIRFAVTKRFTIEDADYYAEDGEILDRRYDDIDYQELVDILEPEYFKGSDNNPTEEKPLWTSEY